MAPLVYMMLHFFLSVIMDHAHARVDNGWLQTVLIFQPTAAYFAYLLQRVVFFFENGFDGWVHPVDNTLTN